MTNLSSATSTTTSNTGYVPGVCNINSAEVAYRRRAGFIMLAITLALTIAFFVLGSILRLPAGVRLLLFVPIFITAVCFLQVKYRFCVNYGANGKQNANEGDTVAQEIVDKAAKKLDQDRTRKIKLQAAGIAAVVALILLVLPF